MDAASPAWWRRFDADRQDQRLRDAARTLRGDPAPDPFGEQAASLAGDILAIVARPAALSARDWRHVQEATTRLLAL